jgi:chemotaxis response regulator CheB
VRKIRVLLQGLSPMMSDLLAHLINHQADMEVVALVPGRAEALVAVKLLEADVVILPDSSEMPGTCDVLLGQFPDLLVLALTQQGQSGFLYRRTITTDMVTAPPVENILKTIRIAEDRFRLAP